VSGGRKSRAKGYQGGERQAGFRLLGLFLHHQGVHLHLTHWRWDDNQTVVSNFRQLEDAFQVYGGG